MPPVTQAGQRFSCEICGNIVVIDKVGGGTLVCCGQDMNIQE